MNKEGVQRLHELVENLTNKIESIKKNCYMVMDPDIDENVVSERVYSMDELIAHLFNLSDTLMNESGEVSDNIAVDMEIGMDFKDESITD